MTTTLMPESRQRYFNNDGQPAAFGKLYTYVAGTSTPKATYADPAGTTPNPNPIPLDAKGEALIYWDGAYKVDLKQADGSQVTGYPIDGVKTDPAGAWGAAGQLRTDLTGNTGAAMVGFLSPGAGARKRTILDKLREMSISVTDYGADPAGGADSTAAIQAVLNVVSAAGGGTVDVPAGRYRLAARLVIPSFVLLRGAQWSPDPSNGAHIFSTTFYVDFGAGADEHAVEMSHSSGIDGIDFYYPGQVAKSATTPVKFGFTISTPLAVGVYDNIHVRNITLYNSYNGIRLNNGGRWNVENVQGNPLFMGFTADQCLDACRMRNVHFWNFYTQADVLEAWVAGNGTAFEFRRIDQLFGDALFCWNYRFGFHCRDNFWGNLDNILVDKAAYPFVLNLSAQVNVSNFVLIGSPAAAPAIWGRYAGSARFTNGRITSACSVGVQIDDGGTYQFSNVDFANQHAAAVVTSLAPDVYIDNCRWNVPPFGGHNVRVNGERLPNDTTAVALPAPGQAPAAIAGGYKFDLASAGTKTLQWETTYISQRNSLFTLGFDYELVGNSATWYFQFVVQTDTGTSTQVSFSPLYPLILNGTAGAPRRVRIPVFINHGRYKQVMSILVTPTVAVPGAALNLTNVGLFEQANNFTTDPQVALMLRAGYNKDAYGMGQTLFAKGKNRIVLTQPEPGIGRATEAPTAGTWDQGDEIHTYAPVAGGYERQICVATGTPGTWKGAGLIAL